MVETKKTLVARLFAEHGSALQAFLYRRLRGHSDAAELAQEVYLRMLRVPVHSGCSPQQLRSLRSALILMWVCSSSRLL
jgi:DNA-directed RNA polymerase specialized sigma24 family protein